jgi:hypothetical protein
VGRQVLCRGEGVARAGVVLALGVVDCRMWCMWATNELVRVSVD